jgi:phosphoesterase RecJ-like protein
MKSEAAVVAAIRDEIVRRQRFLISSHARPDGDSIGSQLAMAYALRQLGKEVRIVNSDPVLEHYYEFFGVNEIVV